MPVLTLLFRAYCHLCDEMRDAAQPVAARHGATMVEIDVDAHPALEERYGDLVPVLMMGPPENGAVLCHYRFDVSAVDSALREAGG
jgi:hypothetical protein